MATNESERDFWRMLVAFFLPPVGVFMQVRLGLQFWINLLLTFMGLGIGGQIHAAWVITNVRDGGASDPEGGRKFISVLLSYYLPPIGVFTRVGAGLPLALNLLLWLLGWFPGVIHALWVITNED